MRACRPTPPRTAASAAPSRHDAERMYNSAQRLEMPPVPKDKFVEAVSRSFLPTPPGVPPFGSGATLYVRPFMIGSGDVIGVAPAS